MAHVSSAVKEMYLHRPTEALAAGGWGELVFDNRNLGAQAPLVSGTRNIQRRVRQDFLAPNRAAHAAGPCRPLPRRAAGDGALGRPQPMAVSALPSPVTGSSSTWARHGRDDETQELSGGGKSHVS
jgi:hypothetical protein